MEEETDAFNETKSQM